ncbi:hypothetical protein M9Y10_001191 [Tritrichomonas musculus]|uniref:non-specific serine/threonine protein kinase n=1 Tax=Tritrichomonas musculus TaxID=1915356 RepID=A0ABR2L6B9_9EUKA
MEISQICNEFIKTLNSSNNSIKGFSEKTEKIESLCRVLEDERIKQDFIKSSYVSDVIIAVLNMSITAITIGLKRGSFQYQRFEAVPRFFECLSFRNIPLAKEEKDTQNLINLLIDIIIKYVPQADDEHWIFWLKVFTEMMKIPTFFNLFRSECDQSDDNDISYIQLDTLFELITNLMKYKKISSNKFYADQRSLSLLLFSTFLKYSPYPPSPDTVNSIFELSDSLADIDMPNTDFKNLLSILNKLIALSPISFLIDSNSPFHAPFNDKILKTIFEKWNDYQTSSSVRKSASAYLLLFLTTMDALEYPIEQNVYDSWAKRILSVWSNFQNRGKILKSHKYIPYLRTDVEFFKRSNDDSIPQRLIQFILKKNKFNPNFSIIWLFTAIGLYSPTIIPQGDWLKILRSITTFKIGDAIIRDQEILTDFLDFVSVMVDIIESKTEWNNVFIFLINNQPARPISSFYSLISKILSKQKIDTQTVHKYQELFWDAQSNSTLFTIERLRCIHTLIYYFGFANEVSRTNCFDSLISLLDSKDSFSTDYLKQLSLTVYSIISSHPCAIINDKQTKVKEKSIDDVCNRLKKHLEITTAKKKIDSPLQTEELFLITPDSSQITVDDEIENLLSAEIQDDPVDDEFQENNDKDENPQFLLCNYISKEKQAHFAQNIVNKDIKNESNSCLFRLFLTSKMPNFFDPNQFFANFKEQFNENCSIENFPEYFKKLLTLTDEIQAEDFQPFFEEIESFFNIAEEYIKSCDEKIQEFLRDRSMSWNLLNDILLLDIFEDLPLLSEFAVKCSNLAIGTGDHFYYCFQEILSTTVWVPTLHLKICSNLLKLSLSEQQKAEIINSLESVAIRILQVLLVPVKERDEFMEELLDVLIYDNSKPMSDLFMSISKYPVTPSMKLNLLYIMQNNYRKSNQIFDCFWESGLNSPFFIQDDYPTIRLQSIDTIISILKLKEIVVSSDDEIITQKIDKYKFFESIISPYINEMLCDTDWPTSKQTIFTSIKTLISITAEIPELSTKALNIIFNQFTIHDHSLFPNQCINVLFSGLSSRIHFSLFLRQFIPMMISQLVDLSDRLAAYPFDLFFFDEIGVSKNEAKRMFCDIAAPYVISYSIAQSKNDLIDFFATSLKKQRKVIITENSSYICAYLLNAIAESSDEEEITNLRNYYQSFMKGNLFNSPIPLLSFVLMTSEDAIISSYQTILRENKYSKEFIDFRHFIFRLYTNIFKAHHELVQSYYLQQFTLYVSIIFQNHKKEFEEKPTLYSDILALAVNLLEFVPPSESSNLLNAISSNIPDNFNMKMVGFIKNIEDICINIGYHQSLDYFFEKFPTLIDEILIFDFLKERQLEKRTPLNEFIRIAKTKRLNQESIDFLLVEFLEKGEYISQIEKLSSGAKRIVLNEVYKFAVSNPQTLALHLYSEMFLTFIKIHPSPLIIASNKNAPVLLFEKILELARDKNPSISRSALTSLHILLSKNLIPKAVQDNKLLFSQLVQYDNFARPRKKIKRPDEDSPWICKFACKYIEKMGEDQLCHAFASLAASSPEFCTQLFPHLFVECLNSPLYSQIYDEFKRFAEDPRKYFEECKLFVTAFNYLRSIIFHDLQSQSPEWHLKWCNRHIDFALIMEVCLKIGDPFSAYQYAEFAREAFDMSDEPLERIFTHLGVDDLKYGLNINFTNPLSVAGLHLQERRFEKALVLYDNGNSVDNMSKTLCSLHLYNLLNNLNTSEKNIESLWRLRKWDISSEIMREMNIKDHSAGLFTVMQAFASNNEEAITQKLNDFTQNFHFDTNSSVYEQLSNLLDASALDWFHAVMSESNSKLCHLFPQSIIKLYRRSLKKLNQLSSQYYNITESANALHGVFFCILSNLSNDPISLPGVPPKFFSGVITNALENNEIESAQYFITLLQENQKKVPQFSNFEQIRVLYASNSHHAVSLLDRNYKQIILRRGQLNSEKRRDRFNLRVEFARASWNAHTNNLPCSQIFDQLQDVIHKCEQSNLIDLMADAEFTLARIYHRQHREICDYFMSPEYGTIRDIINYEKACISAKSGTKSSSLRNTKQDLKNYQDIISHYKELFSTTIVSAIDNYMNALAHTDKYDLECSFAVVGLWFDYSYTKYKEYVQEVPDLIPTMEELFPKINANKFLPLFYQLAARVDVAGEMSSTQNSDYNTDFQRFLREQMVTSICQMNPNECFPILYALKKNNEKQNKYDEIENLIDSITSISDELRNRWQQMSVLLGCYLTLAAAPQMNEKENSLPRLDKKLLQCTTNRMPFVTIITNSKEIGIKSFSDKITVLNGINRPLLLEILGDDGIVYRQILKGNKDDLRQDAVMQQLFGLSSKLLSKRNPNLSIRYYKVVPLSQTTGVIEFVEGSISISDYLFRKEKEYTGAYTRYYVKEGTFPIAKIISEFHQRSKNYHKNAKTPKTRNDLIKYFIDIRNSIKPVFHFFFIEQFPNPGDWFISRLRYCRHTATNSILGHILGIGDRHLNNIMIDKKTGEIIHIDLGIAFDQGKALSVMELVPFRLTNEIIDGMGWMGKEGIFRKTCEESMKVLRNNTEYFLTVLQVFMSDPLYSWNLVPKNQRDKFNNPLAGTTAGRNKNKIAESVIVTCRRKLEGRETGENLSVEGQVSKLINDATNAENLALMYSGWKPYL